MDKKLSRKLGLRYYEDLWSLDRTLLGTYELCVASGRRLLVSRLPLMDMIAAAYAVSPTAGGAR